MAFPLARDRGISPVIGIVLLVAIAVALVSVSAYMIFGISEEREPAPEVALTVEQADGGVAQVLAHENGDRLVGEKVTLRGAADPDVLAGTNLTSGQEATFYAVEEEIRVVYTGEFGTTYTLDTFEVDRTVPEPDEGCDWVEDRTNDGTDDITIDGVVVNCDVETDGAVEVENGGVVIGDVESDDEDVDIDDGDVYGEVAAGGDLTVVDGRVVEDAVTTTSGDGEVDITDSTVEGRVDSAEDDVDLTGTSVAGSVDAGGDGDVTLDTGSDVGGSIVTGPSGEVDVDASTVGGGIDTGDSVDLSDAAVGGSIGDDTTPGQDVTLDTGSSVDGDISTTAGADVDVDGSSTVSGSVDADGAVDLSGSTVEGSLVAGSDVTVQSSSTVGGQLVSEGGDVSVSGGDIGGPVEGDGEVDMDSGVTVAGPVYSPTSVDVDGVTVEGDVYVDDSEFSCSASTVAGQNCGAYDSRDPGEY